MHCERSRSRQMSRKIMVIKKAYGCKIIDSNGNALIDTTMACGVQIIGHNNKLIRKIAKQVKKGTVYTVPNAYTQEVNNLLKQHINPHLDKDYIFCNTGTEANIRAIRLARAYTGKFKIAIFDGGWHGGIDGLINSDGVPPNTQDLVKTLSYNNESSLNEITTDLAAVIVEPVQGSNPRSDIKPFLNKLQARCREQGVLLILDEVMTGFRLSKLGGAGLFDVTPDIITYGKILGGGFPIGAVGAKSDIMKTKNVFYGGTFSGNPLTMYAAKLILNTIINKKFIKYDYLNAIGEVFRGKLNTIFKNEKIPMQIMGCGPLNKIVFTEKFVKNKQEKDMLEKGDQENFYNNLHKKGVFVNTNRIIQLSMAHKNKDINKIIDAIHASTKHI